MAKKIQKLENKAVKKHKTNIPWNPQTYMTGENYKKAENDYVDKIISDKKFQELSDKADSAEKRRLDALRPYVKEMFENDDFSGYNKYYDSEEYKKII